MKQAQVDFTPLAAACMESNPESGHTSLLQQLHDRVPDLSFEPVLTRSGWYRIGGLVAEDGSRITDNLATWAERESGGDVSALYNKYEHEPLFATRLNGKTHYLVAQTGVRAQDFIQLEVEELQEVINRPLFEADTIPDSIEEIIDPVEYTRLDEKPVSGPRYLFRRVIPIADYLKEMITKADSKLSVVRFMTDWERSSAGESAVFCKHWVLSFHEYTDGYGEPKINAKPITTYSDDIPVIADSDVPRGAELANLIHGFDRLIGYPMAWYFFMLTHKQVSHQIAESIHSDLMGAYAYLPARDMQVLQDWYDHGYGV